ncbi:MAG: hypothetical protein ACFFHD_04965 [Promethearchaeota archaeon]
MQKYKKKKIKRVMLFIFSTALIATLTISILFAVFNVEFSLDDDSSDDNNNDSGDNDDDSGDNDDDCKR